MVPSVFAAAIVENACGRSDCGWHTHVAVKGGGAPVAVLDFFLHFLAMSSLFGVLVVIRGLFGASDHKTVPL